MGGISRTRLRGTVRSVQYVSTALDNSTTSDQTGPATAFSDYTKVVLIPSTLVFPAAWGTIRSEVLSNSNVTVFHDAPGAGGGTPTWAAWAVEFY